MRLIILDDGKTWEDYAEEKAYRIAALKTKGKLRCPKCGLYGCICQTSLLMFDDSRLRTATFILPRKNLNPLEVRKLIYHIIKIIRADNLDHVYINIAPKKVEAET